MPDTPAHPPTWDSNDDPAPGPAPAGPPQMPTFEPPIAATSPFEPPAPSPVGGPQFQPPPTAPIPPQAAPPYQPPMPGVPPPPGHYGGPGQPPPPPNQGWGPPPPPGKKSSNKKLWITLGVIFGVLALAIGGCTIWFVGTVKAPVDEANRFLALVDEGNYAEAVAISDPTCNAGFVPADLDELLGGRRISYDLSSSSITNSSATVSGSFSTDGLDFSRIDVSLQNRDGWRVCGFNLSR